MKPLPDSAGFVAAAVRKINAKKVKKFCAAANLCYKQFAVQFVARGKKPI